MKNNIDKLQRLPATHPYIPQPRMEESELDTPGISPSPQLLGVLGSADTQTLMPNEQQIVQDIYEDILREEPGIDSKLAMRLALEQLREQPMLGYRKLGAWNARRILGI